MMKWSKWFRDQAKQIRELTERVEQLDKEVIESARETDHFWNDRMNGIREENRELQKQLDIIRNSRKQEREIGERIEENGSKKLA